jgi:SAM-dependent methyltransferase
LQWWLADRGAQVVSVDRASRRDLSMRFRMAYRTGGLQPSDYEDAQTLARRRLADPSTGVAGRLSATIRAALASALIPLWPKAPGEVLLYHVDLGALAAIPDASMDSVVSVSALEHNDPDHLGEVVAELLRVLKPGGLLLATLGAARDDDWHHQPSQGWCYTEGTLRKHFSCLENCPSNYPRYDELFAALRNNQQLQNSLSPVYFESGDNGMPWGVWDPQYQPVGVLKRKEE